MTSRHSLYKNRKKYESADDSRKTRSSMQVKVNILNKRIATLLNKLEAKNYTLKKHGQAFKKLVDDGIVTKEYLKPYLPRREDALKAIEKKQGAGTK